LHQNITSRKWGARTAMPVYPMAKLGSLNIYDPGREGTNLPYLLKKQKLSIDCLLRTREEKKGTSTTNLSSAGPKPQQRATPTQKSVSDYKTLGNSNQSNKKVPWSEKTTRVGRFAANPPVPRSVQQKFLRRWYIEPGGRHPGSV